MPLGTNDNKQYGASDFERYYSGGMSAQEMHALEKAALDDPFLADALEGYKTTRTPVADTAWLKSQLEARAQKTRVVPLKKSYSFLRIAALVVLLLGAGWSVYYLADNKKDTLALDTNEQKEATVQKAAPPALAPDTATPEMQSLHQTEVPAPASTALSRKKERTPPVKKEAATETATAAAPPVANIVADDPPRALLKAEDPAKELAAAQNRQAVPLALEGKAAGITVQNADKSNAPIRIRGFSTLNNFQGRVVDANHQGVPNATVSMSNNRSTVTTNDEGYFSLNAPDTTVKASVAAIGYETQSMTLNKQQEKNDIVLKPTTDALSEVVVVGYGKKKRSLLSRSRKPGEPYPAEGWDHFEDYLQKNRKPVEALYPQGLTGSVVLSFGVDRKGTPINIKVDSPLSPQYDEEAIRLLRQGPKWKREKGTRGTLTITFP